MEVVLVFYTPAKFKDGGMPTSTFRGRKRTWQTRLSGKKLLELCPASSSLLICEEHKKTVIPNLSEENEQGAISLKDRGLELVTKEHCTALLKSINTLRDIIFQDKEHSSDAIGGMEHPVALVDQDHTLIHIEPERCDKGCVCLACGKEPERENEQNEVQVLDCAEEESEPQK